VLLVEDAGRELRYRTKDDAAWVVVVLLLVVG